MDGVTTTYHYNNGYLLFQTTGDETLHFYYGSTGKVVSIGYQKGSAAEISYFFTRNAQGDIIGVYRSSDSKCIGTYEYDLWGRSVSVTEATAGIDTDDILNKNPFRYRGYYFDNETGFYYLNARYYDSEIRRFFSADSVIAGVGTLVEGYNLFGYCFNNPVNQCDPSGNWPIENILVGYLARKYVKAKVEYVYEPAVDNLQNALSKVDGTYSVGKSISGSLGSISLGISRGITVDTKGNIAIQRTITQGLCTESYGISETIYCNQMNVPSYEKLNGETLNIGGSVSAAYLNAGAEANFIFDEETKRVYYGKTTQAGAGVSIMGADGEGHITFGETITESHINVFDIANWYFDYVEGY